MLAVKEAEDASARDRDAHELATPHRSGARRDEEGGLRRELGATGVPNVVCCRCERVEIRSRIWGYAKGPLLEMRQPRQS